MLCTAPEEREIDWIKRVAGYNGIGGGKGGESDFLWFMMESKVLLLVKLEEDLQKNVKLKRSGRQELAILPRRREKRRLGRMKNVLYLKFASAFRTKIA